MALEFIEASRLGVHTILQDGVFWGLVVNTRDHPYMPTYEIHKFNGRGFEMIRSTQRVNWQSVVSEEMIP